MKREGILNRKLLEAIGGIGHTQIMVIADAGLPVPDTAERIDLAVAADLPTVPQVLELVQNEMIYEKVIVAEEQKLYNPEHHRRICDIVRFCQVETVPHDVLLSELLPKAKYVVRTGSFEPWGNVMLVAGIDANAWFGKPGVITPDYYEERAKVVQKGGMT